jgi:hypothetical protein
VPHHHCGHEFDRHFIVAVWYPSLLSFGFWARHEEASLPELEKAKVVHGVEQSRRGKEIKTSHKLLSA